MCNDQNLMQQKKEQKQSAIRTQTSEIQANAGAAGVINEELEKHSDKSAKKKVPLFPLETLTFNEIVGGAIGKYEKILKEDQDEKKAVDVKYDKFENMTMKEVLKAMEDDTHLKHKEFMEMESAFRSLVNYGENYSKAKKSGNIPLDINDVFRIAETTARYYQVSHKKILYGHDYGKERYKLSCRILDIINGLKSYTQQNVTNVINTAQKKVDDAQVDLVIDEQSFSDKEKGIVIGDWLKSGKEYKSVLKKMLKDQKLLEKDKLTLARIVADKNRRLIANKVTLKLVCDEHPDLTLQLSSMKDKLNDYLSKKINTDDESKKIIFEEIDDFRAHIDKLLKDYKNDNKNLIEKVTARKKKFTQELGIDENDQRYWSKSDINDLLVRSEDDGFADKLQTLKTQSADNLVIIDQFVQELGYSSISAESIKEKIKSFIGPVLVYGGEVQVAAMVKDSIRRIKYLAADEYEAETRIGHLMNTLQIPKTDRDVFAKFLSEDGTVGGVLKQKSSELRKRADTYYANLKGVREAEKVSRNKKLRLTAENWGKLEELKNNMGTYDKKSFKKELDKILKSDKNGRIDVSKPNISYAEYYKSLGKERVRHDVGFTARIMGEFFLDSKDIKAVLNKDEIEYFRQNLISKLSNGGKDIGNLEFLPTGAIRSISVMLKKNLVNNKEFVRDLREQHKDNKAIVNEVLMEMTMSPELLDVSDLNDIVTQVLEKHAFDGHVTEEKDKMMEALKAGGSNDATLSGERYTHFIKQLDFLKKWGLGKYELFAEKLISKNEVFKVMMDGDQKTLEKYLKSEVDKKLGRYIDAINASKMQKAFKQIYVDRRFDLIYDGKLEGEISHIKEDMLREQKKFFGQSGYNEGSINKTISEATDSVVKDVVGKDKSKAKKIGAVYSCAEAVISDCYNDKSKLSVLSSKMALKDEIKKTYERFDSNKDIVDRKIKELGNEAGSIFFGYGKVGRNVPTSGYLNAASFMKTLSKKMMFTAKEDFINELPALIENYEKTYKKTAGSTPVISDEMKEKGKEVIDKKADRKTIREGRDKFIGLDNVSDELKDIFKRKALVTIGTDKGTSLSHTNWQKSRDYIKKEISKYYDLDPFLTDLIVEKNVNGIFSTEIKKHAKWLYNMAGVLGTADEKEEKISQDEQRLLLVNAYRNMKDFEDKDIKGVYRAERSFVKGAWYKTFRKNYKELKKIEDLKIGYAPLEQERINITRDLRALLSTGIGIKDQDEKAKQTFEEKAKKAYAYIDYVNRFMKCADEALDTDADYKKENRVIKNNYLLALRQYFHEKIISEVSVGKSSGFDETVWKEELSKFAADKTALRYICRDAINESVSSKVYNKSNRNFSELMGRDSIEKLIKEKGSHGCEKKYNKLTEEEKELFALGLMLMEKGAIGFDAGSVSVLTSSTLRDKEVEPRLKELTRYMAGQDYDFKIDYDLGYYKLTNTGLDFFGDEKEAFSSSAFEKAWVFAKSITGKMKSQKDPITKEDKTRMGDGISSIYEAALLGKGKQMDEVDKLRKDRFDTVAVKDKLLEYAKLDKEALSKYEKAIDYSKTAAKVPLTMGAPLLAKVALKKANREIEDRKKVAKRLEKMDSVDMYRLIAILQNRAVLDDSSKESGKHIDEDKRVELKLLFSEDNQEKALEKFGSGGACMQALITALSFKVKDNRSLKDSRLGKKDFDTESYERKSLVDWHILSKAIDLLDELDKDRLTRYALQNAPKYIEATGNKKAIEAYREHVKDKDPASITRDSLEEFLKKESEKDRVSEDYEDAKLALSGYVRLNENQKKLFIKVLARRDFLDISKKNLYFNIFRSSKERCFANETGRFRLMDEYIDQTMSGNKGVTLSETAYADAFKSLLSTQVDDTADFKSAKTVEDVLAKEKYYIFKRDTAVDWKLFIRALQFVNRATYELDLREGNEELYRSAGDITRHGQLSMDYSILRQNIHNTGNQFFRAGVQQGKKLITKDALGDLATVGGVNIFDIKNGIKDVTKLICPSLYRRMDKLDEMLKLDEEKKEKRIKDLPKILTTDPRSYDIKGMVTEQLVGKLYTSESSLNNEINELIVGAFSEGIKVDKIGDLIRKKMEEKPELAKDKRLDAIIGDYKVEQQYGDIRDEIHAITGKYNELRAMPEEMKKKIYAKIHMDDIDSVVKIALSTSIKETIENKYSEAIAYVLSKVDPDTGEVEEDNDTNPFVKQTLDVVKSAISKYREANGKVDELLKKPQEFVDLIQDKAKEVTSGIIEGAIGKEGVEFIKSSTELFTGFADSMLDKVSWVVGKVNKYKVYIDGFRDIALSIQNKRLLNKAENMSNSQETREKDKKTLKDAEAFENERQKKIKENVVEEHRDLQHMSKETANTIQNMAIAKDVIDMSMALGEEIFGKLDAGVATSLVKSAVDAGVQFAFYCIRCIKDRKMLRSYYTETDKGQKLVSDIKGSYEQLSGSKEVMQAELMDRDVLDIVCKGSGYENEDELVRDTGMKMATSIAYCASKFNPVRETKVMATTVMLVLGLKDQIGKTDASAITGIFDKMKAA